MSKIYLDEKGYQEYLQEIDNIKEKIRKNSCDISEYQSDDAYGDGWHDNFAYEQAIIKERSLMYELDDKVKNLDKIEIIKRNKSNDIADINTIVEIRFNEEDETEKFLISGSSSSDINKEIPVITLNSPLGKAIYKKKKDDTFTYEVDNIKTNGRIINISES